MFFRKTANSKKQQKKEKIFTYKKVYKKLFLSWVKAIILATVIILLIRVFVFQTVVLSSSSMAGNLMPGDWVLINKVVYGPRLPITPLVVPFKTLQTKQERGNYYLDWISLPYLRIKGLGNIKRNDILVFNYPVEDDLPIDIKIINVKRCVALPGDTLKITDNILFINNKKVTIKNTQFEYFVKVKGKSLKRSLIDKYQISEGGEISNYGEYELFLTSWQADSLKKENSIVKIIREAKFSNSDKNQIFPHNSKIDWTLDNFGPVIIPKAGEKLSINKRSLVIYREMLEKYEKCRISVSNDSIYIDKKYTQYYIPKLNYFFVLDDNRDNAKDSRLWGFLPESHIIGKVSFIIASIDPSASGFSKIRWNRILHLSE
jgi:signal peptidase I